MKYELDITNSYQQFICLDNNIGIESYLSFDLTNINDNFEINLENLEVNINDSIWYAPIIAKNPRSIIYDGLSKIDLDDYSSILTLLLRKAKLMIKNVKCIYVKFNNNNNNIYHTIDSNFSIGDKYIWLSGKSADYSNTFINLKVVFSGTLNFIFEESDTLIQTIEFDNFFTAQNVENINKYQKLIVELKNRSINQLEVNNIRSQFLEFNFSKNYFNSNELGNIAIKDYKKQVLSN